MRRVRIPVGSWLVTPRDLIFHHAVYIGRGRVVHYSGKSRDLNRGPVEITTLENFTQGQTFKIKKIPGAKHRGKEAAERAKNRVGENSYDLLWNNCEHFASWVVCGVHWSEQVQLARGTAMVTGAAGRKAVPEFLTTLGPKLPFATGIVAPVVAVVVVISIGVIVFKILNRNRETRSDR